MDGGMEPCRPVVDNNKVCSWVRLPRLEGMEPSRFVIERCNVCREVHVAIEVGIWPVRFMPLMYISSMVDPADPQKPKVDGSDPWSL